MAVNMTVDEAVDSMWPQRFEMLAWLNETLQTRFTKIEQVCTGAAYCQLMDCLFPGSLDLSRVRFQSSNMVDSIHNYSLLQAAFREVEVKRHVPVDALIVKNKVVALTFLLWFKTLFDKNNNGRKYHALEARGGQSMVPDSDAHSSQSSHQKLEIILKMKEPRKEKPRETSNRHAEEIVLISDDEDDVVDVTMEEKTDKMETMEIKRMEQTAVEEGKQWSSFNDNWLPFIRRYCSDNSADPPHSLAHPRDIVQACYQVPYCLYLYAGVELGGGQRTSVMLIGYFDQSSGVGVVKLLHTLQMSVDSDTTPDKDSVDTDARLLVETLKKFNIPLSNLAVFYCRVPHLAVTQFFVSHLQVYNSKLISLCGLPGMAGRACQAGLLPSFRCVVDLVRNIHCHYSTCPSVNDSLKEVFADTESYNPTHPLSKQCLFIINIVQKMANCWRDIVEYFKSLRQTEDIDRIRTHLMDHKTKLYFLFLSHALEPLRALQEQQQYGTVDVAVELELTSRLISSYTGSLLQPSVAKNFLRKRLPHLLSDEKLLPMSEVNIGSRARDFLWATATVDLGDKERRDFLQSAAGFYSSALRSLVNSVPEHLGDVALRNISKVLKHPENIKEYWLPRHVLIKMGTQLGAINTMSLKTRQELPDAYFSVLKTVKEEQMRGGGGHCWAKAGLRLPSNQDQLPNRQSSYCTC
ncbi:Microtubule-associated protein RP/EB family member 3 EB1 protein family member 3 [Collichthys lucidus]|uniref:Microtubule-associated protein RP/EB family member 3 EB1 protein family member 3 n=1 Tax=Collichthys lucidus TaxID=240159 RepID=A0A4U5UNE8_COLLU|nr:Microtubule-associated protein RP/EB family member 3 EB1 protein family member 3 [Collichthys lucidus]